MIAYRAGLSIVLLALLSGCGSSGGGGSGSGGGGGGGGGTTTSTYDLITASITSGATPDAAVGDTGTFTFTGAPPSTTRIAHPLVTHFAADVSAGAFTFLAGDGESVVLTVTSATQATLAATITDFNPTTGAQTGTTSYATTETIAAHVAPPASGAFTATVTAVTTGSPAVSVGDTFPVLITPSGFLSLGDQGLFWVGLAKSGSQWYGQSSLWNTTAGAVETTKMTIDAGGTSGSYLSKTGSTTDVSFSFTIAPLTVPSTITGAKTDVAGNAFAGTAPGYTTTAYVLAAHPANTPAAISVNATAATMTVSGLTYQLDSVGMNGANLILQGFRYFTDSSLTTSDKRVSEFVFVETTNTGTFVSGFFSLGLWSDPTPTNNGGASDNDDFLGFIELVP